MNWEEKEKKALEDAEREVLISLNLTNDRKPKFEEQKKRYEIQKQTQAISRVSEMALKMSKITNTHIKTGKLVPLYDEKTNEIINFSED